MLDLFGKWRPVELGKPLAGLPLDGDQVLAMGRAVLQATVEPELVSSVLKEAVEGGVR